jgi:hypothetical protein
MKKGEIFSKDKFLLPINPAGAYTRMGAGITGL